MLQKIHTSPPEVDVWQPIQPVQFSVAVKAVVCNNEKNKEVAEESDEDTSAFCQKIRFLNFVIHLLCGAKFFKIRGYCQQLCPQRNVKILKLSQC